MNKWNALLQWIVGRKVKVWQGKDQITRVVEIKTLAVKVILPVSQVAVLPIPVVSASFPLAQDIAPKKK